ncbi:hypothetical protein Pmar_PMAR016122 [Perkinsus marinus ATCC 50983]|uniref:Uncharacterized protein n=1 Tax=Perkinsus marinus (strain ATCC 50983 / TXsc) TaxID=423536 RepID=C5LZ35_PERM5|nr:hypothetical protein Pmar_PMAR016122 [Perkinsus marinus ATCC 50983]EEQ98044.1 hypothetical protein Pmar_PMAR016122 [Perkinsus marinus ATCC 50983]|eukprot:XP_002765327.1 hypothetical protein Pmar_PMAR016122 [Perkinsus marinus ATCC 50983]
MPRKERKGPDLHRGGHDHVMNHQYRPVMHDAPHGDYIDHPYHRDHSNLGPEGHKKHGKGHKEITICSSMSVGGKLRASIITIMVMLIIIHMKVIIMGKTIITITARTITEKMSGRLFEEASMKMSSVPKKHFMSEQSDAEQLSSEERKTIGNRKIRRQRSQEQQRRDKAVRKQINNQSPTGQSTRESFQVFHPFDKQFPSYMGQEDSKRVSTYSPWDPDFVGHAAHRPWLGNDDEEEERSNRKVVIILSLRGVRNGH